MGDGDGVGVGVGDGFGVGVGDGVGFGVGVGVGDGEPGVGVGLGVPVAGEDNADVPFTTPQPARSNKAQAMPSKIQTLKPGRKVRFIRVSLQGELEGYGGSYSGCIRLTPICWKERTCTLLRGFSSSSGRPLTLSAVSFNGKGRRGHPQRNPI